MLPIILPCFIPLQNARRPPHPHTNPNGPPERATAFRHFFDSLMITEFDKKKHAMETDEPVGLFVCLFLYHEHYSPRSKINRTIFLKAD